MKRIVLLLLLIPSLVFGFDLQKAIDDAGGGALYLPVGEIVHTGVVISRSVTIIGSGWMWDGTVLRNIGNGPNIRILNPDMIGAKITNLMLTGNGDAIDVCSEGNNLIERVYIEKARRGIVFNPNCHSTMLSIIGNRFQALEGDAIYGRTVPEAQVNAITIRGNHVIQNHGNGINVLGNQVWMSENIVQGNLGIGMTVPYSMTQTDINTLLKTNYFEQNGGGNIVRSWK